MKYSKKKTFCHSEERLYLVGFSGKVKYDRRLLPLRSTRKYRRWLELEESARREKMCQISELSEKCKNMSQLIHSLRKENKNNANETLVMELSNEMKNLKNNLSQLKSNIGTSERNVNGLLKDSNAEFMVPKANKNQESIKKTESVSVKAKMNNDEKIVSSKNRPAEIQRTTFKDEAFSDSLPGCFESEINVKGKHSVIRTVKIDLFSTGENLLTILEAKYGLEPNSYRVRLRKKLLDKRISLFHQGIFHGTTVRVDAELGEQRNTGPSVADVGQKNFLYQENETMDILADEVINANDKCSVSESLNVKSQVLVRDSTLTVQSIHVDLLADGADLVKKLRAEFGGKLSRCEVFFGTTKLNLTSSLLDQGISHGCTIELNVGLCGGMESEDTSGLEVVKKSPETSGKPGKWTKLQVSKWIDDICDEYEIDKEEVADLKRSNGKGLDLLDKDDWIRRSPTQGDLLFKLWRQLKAEQSSDVEEPQKQVLVEEKKATTLLDEKPSNIEPTSRKNAESEAQVSKRAIFGQATGLNTTESITVKQLIDNVVPVPENGEIISVRGICRTDPVEEDGTFSLILSDNALDSLDVAGVSIDVVTNTKHELLHPEAVKAWLRKIEPGTYVCVKGRVAKSRLGSYPASLRFRIIIDSETDSFVHFDKKEEFLSPAPEISRQSSTHFEMHRARVDGILLKKNSVIAKKNRRVFCCETIIDEIMKKKSREDNIIKKYAVAFKNSFDGDIYVGVEDNGVVSGVSLAEGDLLKWREKIAQIIGGILPGTDEQLSFCENYDEAQAKVGKECFILIMKLCDEANEDEGVIWIHIPKGSEKIYFSKGVPAFVRVGAETKQMTNYKEFFSLLESLKYRITEPSQDLSKLNERVKHTYKLFKTKRPESHEREFKMVFSQNPVKKIVEEYVGKYCCGFLNSHPGTIYFGVQENNETKEGIVVGIVLSTEQRKELLTKSTNVLEKFYPPVDLSLISVTFNKVEVPPSTVLKYCDDRNNGKAVLLKGPGEEVGPKLAKFLKSEIPEILVSVIRVNPESFCIVVQNLTLISEDIVAVVKDFGKKVNQVSLKSIEESELLTIFDDLYVVEIAVEESHYPVHLTKPLDTYICNSSGELCSLSSEELVRRFEMKHDFKIDEFLKDVNNFDPAGNSYIMISSPFELPAFEQDLYGLVIPKWTLAIDFDQDPKEEGHFFHLFEKLHDRYHKERDRCLVTPQSDTLDLNADHGVCWLAARGHKDIADSLSQETDGKNTWNITHRKMITKLLTEELTRNVMPSKIHVVVFWDKGCKNLSYSLNLLLADILSICDNTSVTFVCSTSEAYSDIDKDVKLLKENCTISNESVVHIAPLHVLAKHLAVSLPETFRPEDDYQVPRKVYTENTSLVTVPTELPQRLRQNIHGRLKIMYINKSGNVDEKVLQEERKKFYTGSQITMLGLRGHIGIKREKLKELEQVFNNVLSDKKSRVSLIKVKADRGAGTTTMCLQFLYQHHEKLPCAQLVEIHRDLLSFIEKINQITNLPLLLLVDDEVGNLQEFLDFKKEAEDRRTALNIIFLLVEPVQLPDRKPTAIKGSGKAKRLRRIGDNSLYGTSYYKELTLKGELEKTEVEKLSSELLNICPDEAKDKVIDLRSRAVMGNGRVLRSFAYFSLTAFGKEFSGLSDYVKFRLQSATDLQKNLLGFLSLTHVFTGYKLPASALARLLNKDKVSMKSEFSNVHLEEMLSPPAHETDSRRISFLEVANEILNQLAEDNVEEEILDGSYWAYIKHIAVKMAREVLSVNIGASKIDRLTRKLFVISEYESEKFSSLIRSMRNEASADTARDTLIELVEVFRKHASFRAHLLAHLAKYYMIEYKDYQNAKTRIEEAVKDLPDDPLLHHIRGDIIRRHIDKLKNEETVNMSEIVRLAIESSCCFQEVRERRPHMSHGYASDALVQITVMQACIKSVRSERKNYGFVEYLIEMVDGAKNNNKLGDHEKYLLGIITCAHEYLNESSIDYDHKETLMRKFNECIPEISELTALCDKLKTEKKNFSGVKGWIDKVIHQTYTLFLVLEIENKKNMNPEDFELRIKAIEESPFYEGSMKYWFRYVRYVRSVPSLCDVEKRVKQWISNTKKGNKISPHAEFYNYVVAVLIAIKDPNDKQKMERAAELVSKQQRYKNTTHNVRKIPHTSEWLCPKQGSHVNSIDSLLHSDDLLKESSVKGKTIPLKEKFESCLQKRNVVKWEGVVKKIKSDWQGTITFKRYIDVHFVPHSIRLSKPAIGDTVLFHLSFDWHGPRAWSVRRVADSNSYRKSSDNQDSDSADESDNEKHGDKHVYNVPNPIWCSAVEEREETTWSHYVDEHMMGVIKSLMVNKRYGFISHPDVEDGLYFRLEDVQSSASHIEELMVLEFHVAYVNEKVRATNIHLLENPHDIEPAIVKYRRMLKREFEMWNRKANIAELEPLRASNNPSQRFDHFSSRFETTKGYISRFFEDRGFGFICGDGIEDRIFFHRDQLMPGVIPTNFTRVQFRLERNQEGYIAKHINIEETMGW